MRLKAIVASALLMMSGSLWAIPVTTVGGVDNLVSATKLSKSSVETEQAWVESVLGYGVQFDEKLNGGFAWEKVDGTAATYATAFDQTPDYYLVKTGKLKETGNTHFLFQNVSDLYYGVINLIAMGFTSKEDIGKISHITLFDSPVKVPEPSTLALLALGLMGLGFARRKSA